MSHANVAEDGDTVTFRLDPAVKAELTRLAEQDRKTLGDLLGELARERVALERRRAFEAEAERQCLAIAERARTPGTDDYAMMQEMEADLDDFLDEWKA